MAKLWKRPDNGYYYVLWQDKDKARKQSLKTKDHKEATKRFNNFDRDLRAGKIAPISSGAKHKLKSFVDEFLSYIEPISQPSTYKLYDVALKKALQSWGGSTPLSHITARHIDSLVSDMARIGLSNPTINKNIRHVKAALSKAYEWEYIVSPIKSFPKPLKEEQRVRSLTKEQLSSLMAVIDDPEFFDFCQFAVNTGLRSGEILRLKWTDVDNPSKGFLRISSKQKSKTEELIPYNKTVETILERCRMRKGSKPFRFDYLTWVSQKFKAYARSAGLGHIRFHDLRHTFGGHLAMLSENEAVIQALMRHKSISSTLVYTRVSKEYLREACERVNYGPMPIPSRPQKSKTGS